MRRLTGEDGAVAVLVALLAVVLFGFGALVVDVGALYFERRQLQVGADAASLAIAQACAAGNCGAYDADAEIFSDGNALDDASRVEPGEVCGSTDVGLPACIDPPNALVGSGYVRVTTRTEQADGSLLVPPFLARLIVPGYSGTDVSASAVAAWGPAGSVEAGLALTFSQCEYEELTTDGAGNPVYATEPFAAALEKVVFFHGSNEAGTCAAGPSGADLPGGFGWLDGADNCTATVDSGWVGDDTGASASKDCKAALENLLGQTVLIPVFNDTNGLTGTNGQYKIWSYVGFVLTGWRFPGTSHASAYLPGVPCNGSQTCLSGFFVEVFGNSAGPIGTGPDQGVRVVQLIS